MSGTEESGTYLSHWRLMKRILVATDGSVVRCAMAPHSPGSATGPAGATA